MKLDIKALALAFGLLWGAVMLLAAVGNMLWPPYGGAFLNGMASIYPGYQPGGTLGSVMVGTIYGVVDGAIGGLVFAWLYNRFSH